MKNNSTSSLLPIINRPQSLAKPASSIFYKPALHKIIYPPPLSNKHKQNYHSVMLQSCISNKLYDDVLEQNNEKKIKEGLQPSEEGSSKNLLSIPTRVGKQAPFQYYHQYKSLQKTLLKKDVNALPTLTDSVIQNPVVSLLEKADSLRILPLCLGLVKSKGEASILNINNYNLGDRYMIALAAGLKKARSIQKMYLRGNRITDISLGQIADAISSDLAVLQLGHNKITSINKRLLQLIIEPEYRLESLGLASNFLMQSSAETVLRNGRYSKHLRRLDLRDNRLSSSCEEALSQLIEKSNCLQELYIGVNYLGKSGQIIFNKLAINKTLRVFDFSLNQQGQETGQGVAQAISNCLKANKTLQHLDLSFNNFNKEASQLISDGLVPNKSLLGFHFKGNYGYVNSKGFLIVAERQGTYLHSVDKFQIDGFEVTSPREHNSMASHLFRNVCWICEGWYERQFKLAVPKNEQKILVYIHFDFQKYQPRLISLTENVKYVTMVPPKKYRYFYTVNNEIFVDQHIVSENMALPETYTYQMNHVMRTFKIETVNYSSGKAKKIANEYKQIIIKTLPRNNGLTTKKQKISWTFGSSVWAKEYRLQDQQLLRKCFERDWKCSKLSNLVKNQLDQDKVKESLWKRYPLIKSLYKQFSSWSPFGDIWAVSSQPFTQFCQQSKIISKQMPLKIIDLTFITTNSMSGPDWKGNILNPQRGLVRFQFMQSLVRLAEQKYKKLGITDNFADSIENILRDHVFPLSQSYNPHQWRSKKYFNEFNDALIKKYRPIFSALYKRNSKLKVKPGQKPYMCLMEFKGIFQRLGLTTTLAQRDILVAFNNAMMTQVDELQSQRFIRMNQIQFIEGVARCANSLSSQYTLQQMNNPPLHFKLEWIIQHLKSLCPQDIKAQFPDSQKTIFREQEQQE